MGAMEDRVVVMVKPQVLKNEALQTFAARIRELGLTTYASTHDEAVRKVKRMFAVAVQARRERGELADWLNRSGVEWYWESDYTGDIPVEEADAVEHSAHRPTAAPSLDVWRETVALGIAA